MYGGKSFPILFLKILSLVMLVMLSILSFSSNLSAGISPSNVSPALSAERARVDFSGLLNSINYSMVEKHIRFLSSRGSRISGYPGFYEAADYISESFRISGLNVSYQKFNVTVPIDYGATLKIKDGTEDIVKIYPMEPNMVSPVVVNNLIAPIVYVGKGSWEEIEGKPINGSILLMEYESGINWIKAAKIGAKAVIFIEPTGPDLPALSENRKKHLYAIPFNFPRFYIKHDSFLKLYSIIKAEEPKLVSAEINSKVVWEQREVINIIGTMEGHPYNDQVIILSSHYDSYSSVLSVAPGANDAVGIATLLEIARLLNTPKYRPIYRVMFVAYAGHYQVLEGARRFYLAYLSPLLREASFPFPFPVKKMGEPLNVTLQLNIQISSMSDTLVTMNAAQWILKASGVRPQELYNPDFFDVLDSYVTEDLIKAVNSATGMNYKLVSACLFGANDQTNLRDWFSTILKMDDAEVLAVNNGPGYIIQTVDNGDYLSSPVDTVDRLNLKNLKKVVGETVCIAYGLTQTHPLPTSKLKVKRFQSSFKGTVAEYNPLTDSYDPIPGALVFTFYPGWSRPMVTISKEDGSFLFYVAGGWSWGGPIVTAFVVDNSTGNVVYALDRGVHAWTLGEGPMPWGGIDLYRKQAMVDMGYLVLFKCGTIVLFDVLHPYDLRTFLVPKVISVLTEVAPESWGYHRVSDDYLPASYDPVAYPSLFSVVTVYVPPKVPVAILLTSSLETLPLGIVANATYENPRGYGYTLKAGEQYVIHNSALEYARGVHFRSLSYTEPLRQINLLSRSIIEGRELTEELISKALNTFQKYSYSKSYALQIKAWTQSREPYLEARQLYVELVSLVPFFALLLIPFVFLSEKLVFHIESGKRRLILLLVIFVLTDSIFNYMHPGFKLAFNPLLVVIAFFIIILILPSLYILLNYIANSLKVIRVKEIGRHFVEVSRSSAISLSFHVGIENMRKRKMRSFLLLITIILIVIGLVLFSSLESIKYVKIETKEAFTPYNGIFINFPVAEVPNMLGINILDLIQGLNDREGGIFAKACLYTPIPADDTGKVLFNLTYNDNEVGIYVLTGISTNSIPTWFEAAPREGRWFLPGEKYACILPSGVAEKLGVSVHERITLLQRNFTVTAIIDSDYLSSVVDMNGISLLPMDKRVIPQEPVFVDDTIIVPLDFVLDYNPIITVVQVIPQEKSDVIPVGDELFEILKNLNIIAGADNKQVLYRVTSEVTLFGWEMQIIPIVTAAFMILNIILGSVKEREKDIFVFSAVGLSPLHIVFLFLSETLIYGIVGSTIGYVISMCLSSFVSETIGVTLNYSSTFAVITLSITIFVTVISSIYPAFKASKLITPSLERTWKIPTKPVGNTWEIPLPIVFTDKKDIIGISRYLKEYIISQSGEVGIFSPEGEITITQDENLIELAVPVRLAPYDQGVIQDFRVTFTYNESEESWSASVVLTRTAGEYELWIRLVRNFATEIRRQFLLWKTFKAEEKEKYMD